MEQLKTKIQELIKLMSNNCKEQDSILSGYSINELEKMAILLERAWSKTHTPEYELLKLVLSHRRWKLNAEFVFTSTAIEKILRLNEQIMDCQEKLCKQAEDEIVRLKQKTENDDIFLHDYEVECKIMPFIYVKDEETGEEQEASEGIDGLLNVTQLEYMLCFDGKTSEELRANEYFKKKLNWNKCDMPGHGELADYYIGYGIHELVDHSLFSLSDILRINYLWGEVKITQQHFVSL